MSIAMEVSKQAEILNLTSPSSTHSRTHLRIPTEQETVQYKRKTSELKVLLSFSISLYIWQ